ncbi:hypothetical protein BSL78_17243 [Apostichopus japonicus]|uniref:Uncharacterized protein n=1 Tax=Stichopus japonicus TaxID=307972 RepID=A0A2G8KD15_STIJA|nr:hypothetical protein BSL78_17243 [Apostichopus japonicus]
MVTRGDGPLQLAHDSTPKDFLQSKPPVDPLSYNPSFRYRGYPKGYFVDTHKPVLGQKDEFDDKYYRRKQHFVKGQPADFEVSANDGQPNEKVQGGISYGTDELPGTRVAPSPKKTPFWNEDRTSAEKRKKLRQVQEADLDVSSYKEKQQQRRRESYTEKKKDLQMLIDYKPWGRPGGGAPREETSNRRTKKMELTELENGKQMENFIKFGQPGHGAPLRTSSGTIVTNLKANNDIRFKTDVKDVSKAVENKMRYKTTRQSGEKYTKDLATLTQERKEAEERHRKQEYEQEVKTWQYDPYGKPGAGAPLKTDSGNLKVGRNKTLVKDGYEMRDVEFKITNRDKKRRESLGASQDKEQASGSEPWGKGTGAPRYDDNGNLLSRFKWSNPNTIQEYKDPTVTWATLHTKPAGGGGLVLDERGEKKIKLAQTLVVDKATGESLVQEPQTTDPSAFNPWGKPGNGAPMTDQSGNIVAANRGKAFMDKMGLEPRNLSDVRAKQNYLSSLKNGIKDQQTLRSKQEAELKKPGDEVASWIRSKEIGYPKRDPATGGLLPEHYKGTSDVTQHCVATSKLRCGLHSTHKPAGGGGLVLDERGEKKIKLAQTLVVDKATGESLVQEPQTTDPSAFNPWGKPGNGAPMTDQSGNIVAANRGKAFMDKMGLEPRKETCQM